MTLGVGDKQGDLLDDVARFCEEALSKRSIYGFLRRERDQLVPEEACCDLFKDRGRRSVLRSVVAVVMVLQRLESLSDREAVEHYCFDNCWRYATTPSLPPGRVLRAPYTAHQWWSVCRLGLAIAPNHRVH